MEDKAKERWMELCELAAQERDPAKLLALTEEIDRLLEEKQQRLNANRNWNPNRRAPSTG
jgi:hypothetical protein